MADDKIDSLVVTITAGVLGVIMLCSFAIPTILDQVATLTTDAEKEYADLISLVILFIVIGLILFLIRRFNNAGR